MYVYQTKYKNISADICKYVTGFSTESYKKLRDMCNTHVWSHKHCEFPNLNFRYKHIIRKRDPSSKHVTSEAF